MDPAQPSRGRVRGGSHRGQSRPVHPRPSLQPRPPVVNITPQTVPRPNLPNVVSQVEQLTVGDISSSTGSTTQTPVGRGAVRGNRSVETEHYRLPRPESSKTVTGKQGITGQPLQLLTNYFPITTYTNWSLYQYRVDFNPPEDRIGVQKGLLYPHNEILGSFIFDGTMLFSSKKYESDKLELTSKRNVDDQIIIITIAFTSVIETGDYANIQVFNLLLRNCLRHLELQLVGRNYYDAKAKIHLPKHKLELWPGYETTIGMFDNGLMLRSEISTKVMRQETVYDFFLECRNNRHHDRDWIDTFKAGVIGQTILTKYNNKTYKIDDVDENSTTNSSFMKKDKTSITYVDYYKQRWQLTIGDVQPLIISKNKNPFTRTSGEEDLIYLVPQFCHFTGLTQSMRNNKHFMREMAIHTQVEPQERINRLYNFGVRLLSTPKSVESLERWNLTLKNNLVELTGRVLPPEDIFDNTKKFNGGITADWTKHIRSSPMFSCASINCWVIITPYMYKADVKKFVGCLQTVTKGMSFRLPLPQIIEMKDGNGLTYVSMLEQISNQLNPSLILCVLQTNRNDIYHNIKRKLCVDRAIPSQVVLLKNIQSCNMSVATKIAVQINCKLGGAPWLVKIPSKGMMIMGFDVCHDTQNRKKSYGAFLATMNETHTKYFSLAQAHNSGEELSTYFSSCTSMALHRYLELNKELPKSIVIYRDGVGDGQISYVHKTEVAMIKEACAAFYKKPAPMAFIIVKKRISTRFFVPSKQEAVNPPPCTVIDNTVTDPSMYDFYLVSQNVRYGTVTPTHYNVLEDNLSNWSPDKMQRLSLKLCHMYYNWSGTVRVPAPCQLAHKLAFLCAQSLKARPNPGLDQLLYFL